MLHQRGDVGGEGRPCSSMPLLAHSPGRSTRADLARFHQASWTLEKTSGQEFLPSASQAHILGSILRLMQEREAEKCRQIWDNERDTQRPDAALRSCTLSHIGQETLPLASDSCNWNSLFCHRKWGLKGKDNRTLCVLNISKSCILRLNRPQMEKIVSIPNTCRLFFTPLLVKEYMAVT